MSAVSGRRLALAGAAVLAAAGLGCSQDPDEASNAAQRSHGRPNIVLVMTDDLALHQATRRYMPKVNRLIRDRGTNFKNAFLTTPLCCPSRATLLTGQYGHNNGVLKNTYPSLRDNRNVLPVWLRRAGYVTAHVGKFLNRYHHRENRTAVAPGWDQWYTELDTSEDDYYDWDMSKNGQRIHYGRQNSDYAPRVFERSALRLVRRFVPRPEPLYLEIDEIAPHPGGGGEGTGCVGTAVPDPRDLGKFQNAQFPRTPSFNEANMQRQALLRADTPAADPAGDPPEDEELSVRPRRPAAGRPHRGSPLQGVQAPR